MRPSKFVLVAGAIAAPATAGSVTVTIPTLKVAEYHRPYVAIWLEPAGGGQAHTLALWYQSKQTGKEPGTKWLSELRTWWRKGGRSMKLGPDGVSGATRAPGKYTLQLPANLKPGQYVLSVEAARETGGREILSINVTVPNTTGQTSGKTELGAITVSPR